MLPQAVQILVPEGNPLDKERGERNIWVTFFTVQSMSHRISKAKKPVVTATIQSIDHLKILNSHADFTTEFQIELDGGFRGRGASPRGETISVYEDQNRVISPESILDQMEGDGCLGRPFDQEGFDAYLMDHVDQFGSNHAFGLSLAFFAATGAGCSPFALFGHPPGLLRAPRLCLNILNGGWHAYTNPVLSDFSEFMLVALDRDVEPVLDAHRAIQRVVKERLRSMDTQVISGNPVHVFPIRDNRTVIEFLLSIRDSLGLARDFGLMIDASASDLWREDRYRFALTDGSARTSEAFCGYWQDLIRDYDLMHLEDPFREQDLDAWRALTAGQTGCRIIGDNLYASDPGRIARGVEAGLTHGTVIKPNQAGTVTRVRRAIEVARQNGQTLITSHRSISTEETFISLLTCMEDVPYIKIGPLETDYSSVLRLNEILRWTIAPTVAVP